MLRLMIQYLNLPLGAVPAVSVEPHDDVEQPPHHMRTISERGNRQPGVKGAVAFVQREQEPRQAQLDVSDADITPSHVHRGDFATTADTSSTFEPSFRRAVPHSVYRL